jgi:hypothetical protein
MLTTRNYFVVMPYLLMLMRDLSAMKFGGSSETRWQKISGA